MFWSGSSPGRGELKDGRKKQWGKCAEETETEMCELSTKFVFTVLISSMLVTSLVLGFLHIQHPLREHSPSWAPTMLGLYCMGAEPGFFQPG